MNKIISANINGFVFSIDELAYAKLKAYLDTIRQKVSNTEVEQDIENRIAELFSARLSEGRTAIFDADVDEVMEQIGRPEDFGAEEGGNAGESSSGQAQTSKTTKRLYRDDDDRVIGGVCSGIAAYFGLDPVIIRLAFAAAFFMFGTGIILYLLLMIILPKAVTPAEKLEMRGEPVDYKNVSKTVERDFRDAYQRYKPEVKTGFQRFLEILVRVGMIVLIIFLLSIVVPGGFGILSAIGIAAWSLPALGSYLFTTPAEGLIILAGLILFVLIPVFGIFWAVIRFAFKLRPMGKVFSILLSILWFSGFCMLAWSTYQTGMKFSQKGSVVSEDTLSVGSDKTLVVRLKHSGGGTSMIIGDDCGNEDFVRIRKHEDMREAIDREISENVRLNIISGYMNKPVIRVQRSSNGSSSSEANVFADRIHYNWECLDSVLYLDEQFDFGKDQLWRNQRVRITLIVPEGSRLYLDRTCEDILDIRRRDRENLLGRYVRVGHGGLRVDD